MRPLLEGWLRDTKVQVLCTSRMRIDLPEEVTFVLGGLEPEAAWSVLMRSAQRARPRCPGCPPPLRDEILQSLDGLPLALEIAGSRLGRMTWARLAELCGAEGFRRLRGRSPRTPRHETMQAVIEQSWTLLDEGLQQALASLAVFRGGFDEAAGCAVLGPEAIVLLDELAEQSMVQWSEIHPGLGRYRLLKVVEQFLDDRLPLAAWQAAVRHYASFAEASQEAYYYRWAAPGAESVLRLELENIDRMLGWCWDNPTGGEWLLSLTIVRCHIAFPPPPPEVPKRVLLNSERQDPRWSRLVRDAAIILQQHDLELNQTLLDDAISRTEDGPVRAQLLDRRAHCYDFSGDSGQAMETLHLSVEVAKRTGHAHVTFVPLTHLTFREADPDLALRHAEEAVGAAVQTGTPRAIEIGKLCLAVAAHKGGNLHRAVWAAEDAIQTAEQADLRANRPLSHRLLVLALVHVGDLDRARQALQDLEGSSVLKYATVPTMEADIALLHALLADHRDQRGAYEKGLLLSGPFIGTGLGRAQGLLCPDAPYWYSLWLFAMGHFAEAQSMLATRGWAPATLHLPLMGLTALASGDHQQARAHFTRCTQLQADLVHGHRIVLAIFLCHMAALAASLEDARASEWRQRAQNQLDQMKLLPDSWLLDQLKLIPSE